MCFGGNSPKLLKWNYQILIFIWLRTRDKIEHDHKTRIRQAANNPGLNWTAIAPSIKIRSNYISFII